MVSTNRSVQINISLDILNTENMFLITSIFQITLLHEFLHFFCYPSVKWFFNSFSFVYMSCTCSDKLLKTMSVINIFIQPILLPNHPVILHWLPLTMVFELVQTHILANQTWEVQILQEKCSSTLSSHKIPKVKATLILQL